MILDVKQLLVGNYRRKSAWEYLVKLTRNYSSIYLAQSYLMLNKNLVDHLGSIYSI